MPKITSGDLIGIVKNTFKVSNLRAKEITNLTAKKAGFTTSMTAYQKRKLDPRQQLKFTKNLGTAVKEVSEKYKVRINKNDKNGYLLRQKIKKAITTTINQSKIEAENKKPKESAADFLEKIRKGPNSTNSDNPLPNVSVSGSALARQSNKTPDQAENNAQPAIKFQHVPLADNLADFETSTNLPANNEPAAMDIG